MNRWTMNIYLLINRSNWIIPRSNRMRKYREAKLQNDRDRHRNNLFRTQIPTSWRRNGLNHQSTNKDFQNYFLRNSVGVLPRILFLFLFLFDDIEVSLKAFILFDLTADIFMVCEERNFLLSNVLFIITSVLIRWDELRLSFRLSKRPIYLSNCIDLKQRSDEYIWKWKDFLLHWNRFVLFS